MAIKWRSLGVVLSLFVFNCRFDDYREPLIYLESQYFQCFMEVILDYFLLSVIIDKHNIKSFNFK